jgi:4-aminobutyrate aminotransferase-like enzyme/Ser/Thr protein kinase RdoA (MazF antagonist)
MTITIIASPRLPLQAIRDHLGSAYGIAGTLSPISADRDQNVRVDAQAGKWLLKLLPESEGFALADAQALALQHIAMVDPTLPVTRLTLSKTGERVTRIAYGGKEYAVLLLRWQEGAHLVETGPADLRTLGMIVARLGKALRGFVSAPLAERHIVWDVMRADELLPHLDLLGPEWEGRARPVLENFVAVTRPKLRTLRAQIIHTDVHPWNILVDDQRRISGIIDFGDMLHCPLVVDPGNAIAESLLEGGDPDMVFKALLRGYNRVTPLEADEADLVPDIAKVRLVNGAVIGRLRNASGADSTEAGDKMLAACFAVLESLEGRDEALRTVCREAIGLMPRLRTSGDALLQRRKAAMGPKPVLFYSKPLHMARGDGVWLYADDGTAYLDCYNNVAHVGHAHPRVADAVARQLHTLNTNTRYLTDESIAYAEALKATVHPSLDAVVFVNSGSEANDVAWRMANVFTGHTGGLCMENAYHGITMASNAVSPANYPARNWAFAQVRLLEPPDVYRGPFKGDHDDRGEAYAALVDAKIDELRRAGLGVSVAVIDSAFMTNGMLEAPKGYVAGVVARVHAAGGLFIADEVQSGFGRLGTAMWGHQHHGVVPDFVTIGKPAGNGYPIGAIITRSDILEKFVAQTGSFFSTFGGGNAAAAAGFAVLDVMREEELQQNALETGRYFKSGLRSLMQRQSLIGDVRGTGLALGVELVRDRATLEPARAETVRVLDLMRDNGVLIGADGKHGNVLKLRPPIVFRREHADRVVETLDKVLAQV